VAKQKDGRRNRYQIQAHLPLPEPASEDYATALSGTHEDSTMDGIAIRLAHFGRHLAATDPDLDSLADLDRQRHIETYLAAVATARAARGGQPISAGEQRNRVITLGRFLADITEWQWPDAPARRLVFTRDIPKLPRALPRYLPPDADRRIGEALHASPNRLFADALLLARATGLRIGELRDLELDCIHEIPGTGAWLKVPLGKLDTERMVPLDDDTVALIDRIAQTRSPGQPLPHPKTRRPTEFLLTHLGRRVSATALRDELARAASTAGLPAATPHQLRHIWATALKGRGVASNATFRAWREDGAIGAADSIPPGSQPIINEKARVGQVHEGEVAPDDTICHRILLHRKDSLMQAGQPQRGSDEGREPDRAVMRAEEFDAVGKPLPTSFNAGCSLQALMVMLGHTSAEMSLSQPSKLRVSRQSRACERLRQHADTLTCALTPPEPLESPNYVECRFRRHLVVFLHARPPGLLYPYC
jgi:integrase